MRERTRAYDEVIRLGGDEFVVVAPVPDVLDALRLADDVREEIALRCDALLPADWGLTATIGVAMYPDAGTDPRIAAARRRRRALPRQGRGPRRRDGRRTRRRRHHLSPPSRVASLGMGGLKRWSQ